MIILVVGLPGSGKTALALELVERTDAIHLNADAVRSDLSSDLGFSINDRIEQARRMGAMARLLSDQGKLVIVDFINPTSETRAVFGDADFTVWVDRIDHSRFEDTNYIWEDPVKWDLRIEDGLTLEEEADLVVDRAGLFDWKKPTTLMLGRFQPWHEGHQALKNEAHLRTDQVLVGVRNTHGTSEKDPLTFTQVVERIKEQPSGDVLVMRLPNITNIVYGRDVGYKIEQVTLPEEIQAISATQKRRDLGL